MNRIDTYAETVAECVRIGPCLTGHDWETATYRTTHVKMDYNIFTGHMTMVQERECLRCGYRVTHIRHGQGKLVGFTLGE